MITSANSRTQYSPNGSTVAFAFPFLVLDSLHLVVILTTAGVDSTKVLGVDFTVSGVGSATGGTVTMTVAPAAGTTLTIYREVPITQPVDYVSNDNFPAETHEKALDRAAMISQQIKAVLAHALQYPASEPDSTNPVLPTKPNRLSRLMGFDASGNLYLFQIDPVALTLTVPTVIDTAHIQDSAVTAAKLAAVLNLAGKTLTLPANCVDMNSLAGTLDFAASGKTIVLPPGVVNGNTILGAILGLDKTCPSTRIRTRLRIGFGLGTADTVGIVISGAGTAGANGAYVAGAAIGGRMSYTKGTITLSWDSVNTRWKLTDSVGPIDYYYGNSDVTTPEQVFSWQESGGALPLPTVEIDTATEVLEVNGRVKSTQFIGDGSALTGFQENIAILPNSGEGGSRSFDKGLAVITSRGELWSCGEDTSYHGRGAHGNLVNIPRFKRCAFKAGVDVINNISDSLNGYTDSVVQFKSCNYTAYALTAQGILYAAGYNAYGQCGQGDTTDRLTFVSIRFGPNSAANNKIVSFSVSPGTNGVNHCAAVDVNGDVWVWGRNNNYQLGINNTTDQLRPVLAKTSNIGMTGKTALQVLCSGQEDGCTHIVWSDGSVWGAGYNAVGQIGNGSLVTAQLFVTTSGLISITQMWSRGIWTGAASTTSVYALKSDGKLYSWGYNGNGEVGDTTTTARQTPFNVLTSIDMFATGGNTGGWCIAIATDNTPRFWGYNNKSQLGNGSTTSVLTPGSGATYAGSGGVRKVLCAGGDTGGFSAVLCQNGDLFCFGYNTSGVMGVGDTTDHNVRTKSLFSRATLTDISFTGDETRTCLLALYSDKTAWAAGNNANGELSLGHSVQAAVPQRMTL